MISLLKIFIAVFPVVLFLSLLVLFDSFKLVSYKSVARSIFCGGLAALVCLLINSWILNGYMASFEDYASFIGPVIEELAKGLFVIYLIRFSRIGFLVDAAILGFAIGAGFGIIENIYHYQIFYDTHLFIWMMRGLGTAVMHGATTAIFAVISKYLANRVSEKNIVIYLPGLIIAIIIHSFYNLMHSNANLIIIFQLILLPLLFWLIFMQSERMLNRWLELSLDTEVSLLEFLVSGTISKTKIGTYLETLKKVYPGETIVDMICYLRIYLEVFIRAKGVLLMKQHGFPAEITPEIKEKLEEFKFLEKSIGRTGKRALLPIFRIDSRELWQLYMLSQS